MSNNKKINWQYYFARKFSLQRFEVVARVFFSDFYKQDFDARFANILIKPEQGGNHAIWLDANEYQRNIRKIFRVVCKNLKTFHAYRRIINRVQKQWVAAAHKVSAQAQPSTSQKKLARLYDTFIHHHQEHFNKPIWIPFPIEPLLSKDAESALAAILKRAGKENELSRLLEVVFSPEQHNAITQLHVTLLRLAKDVREKTLTQSQKNARLQSIIRKFEFIPCYDVIDAPWGKEHFVGELNKLLQKPAKTLTSELHSLEQSSIKHHKRFHELFRSFLMTRRERELLTMAHEMVVIKDERDDYRRMGSFEGRPLFAEIGRRLGLTGREASYLTIEETQAFLHSGITPPPVRTLRERVQGYLLLRKYGSPLQIASGSKMQKILRVELPRSVQTVTSEVTGTVGSTGKASGNVVIVYTKHDLRRVRRGAIMVAVTTNPDFVPAMRICKAIVTDEGGMTAHAAIVSRELHIPCIVGTKLATATFKDGDHVLVDATKGIITKL